MASKVGCLANPLHHPIAVVMDGWRKVNFAGSTKYVANFFSRSRSIFTSASSLRVRASSSSSSLGNRCPLPTSASLPSRDARTQLSRLLLGIEICFAARATDIPVVSTSFTASVKLRRVYPFRYPFHSRPPDRQITRSVGLHFFQPTSMRAKRKQHSAEFKAQVAMAVLPDDRTLAELASEYRVHPTMISTWKQELGEERERSIRAREQEGGRPAGGDRQPAPEDRPVAGRKGILGRTAVQKSVVSVFDWRQISTRRVAQSIAHRYRIPCRMRM